MKPEHFEQPEKPNMNPNSKPPKNDEAMNAGEATVDWLYKECLHVDDEWSTRDANGFTWWANQNAQRIEVIGSETNPAGERAWFVRVRTELLRELQLTDEAVAYINGCMMGWPSMSGPVYNEKTCTLFLSSVVQIHDGNRNWMQRVLSLAALLQIHEVTAYGLKAAKELGASLAVSGHPQNGLRPRPDELAHILPFVTEHGKKPCAWSLDELQSVADRYVQNSPALQHKVDAEGLHIQFDCGEDWSECSFVIDEPHPRYGAGLLISQSFHLAKTLKDKAPRLALHLNSAALGEKPQGYGLGSFAYYENELHFNGFLPNVLYKRNMVPSMFFSCAVRAQHMASVLEGENLTKSHKRGKQKRGKRAPRKRASTTPLV